MPKSLIVKVEPKVLKWLRTRSGWEIEDIAKKLKIDPKDVLEMESGTRNPTLRQLKTISSSYKSPIAVFFLPEPRKEKPLPRDYRSLPDRQNIFDKKTLFAIRRSRYLQEMGQELSLNIQSKTDPKIKRVNTSHNPITTAAKYRDLFDLTWKKQQKFQNAYGLFKYLRNRLGIMNILVFQFSFPMEDARGFVMADDTPPVIVVNSKDTIEARSFTLMHEFGHILLGESVINMPNSQSIRNGIEGWCDQFASKFLLPDNIAKDMLDETLQLTDTETLNNLSKTAKVSKALLLRRMLDMKLISKTTFENTLNRYTPTKQNKKPKPKNSIKIVPHRLCLSEMGDKFVWLVASNLDRNFITHMDALNYLSIKSQHLDKVLSEA